MTTLLLIALIFTGFQPRTFGHRLRTVLIFLRSMLLAWIATSAYSRSAYSPGSYRGPPPPNW